MLKTLGPHSTQGPGPAHRAPTGGWVGGRKAKTSPNRLNVRDNAVYSRGVQLADKEGTRVIVLHNP